MQPTAQAVGNPTFMTSSVGAKETSPQARRRRAQKDTLAACPERPYYNQPMTTWSAIPWLLLASAVALAQQTVPCEILIPVLDAKHQPLTASAPDGKSYPVFQAPPAGKLVDNIAGELRTSYAQQALRLDRYARNLMLSKAADAHTPPQEWLTAPMYFLMSSEEGGFARFGFWLQDGSGQRKLILAGYVDMVVEDDCSKGCIEEIFSHELGHRILRTLVGEIPPGPSRKMHQSMTVTDYPTAFDEGFAEHFQPLSRDAHSEKPQPENFATDFDLFWLSAADTQLRTDGVKHNVYIHRKPLPESAFDPASDPYRVFVDSETSTIFIPTEIKNAQQMMASEGVISTLFYRLVNDAQLRSHYREPSFYRAFVPSISDRPEASISPEENIHLKLFAAMSDIGGMKPDEPPMILLVEHYAKLFPDEAKRIYGDFIATTWGATVSQQLATALTRSAADGGRGEIAAFRHDDFSTLFSSTVDDVVRAKRNLRENLGPELWIANSQFKIAPSMWSDDRSLPLTLHLNAATEPELMTIPGVDLALARKITLARNASGFFRSLNDLVPILPPDVTHRVSSMADEMKRLPPFQRE